MAGEDVRRALEFLARCAKRLGEVLFASSKPVAAVHGEWGEREAEKLLRRQGYAILERNARPDRRDRRREIDIIARDPAADEIVFVEVKQHSVYNEFDSETRSVDAHKRSLVRKAAMAWLKEKRHRGTWRFDVIEVYGTPERGLSRIDHIKRVRFSHRRPDF